MIPYIGGKSYLASWIISNFPKDYQEKTYVEVFGGGGWVLYKKEPSSIEVYNDLNRHLVNLFKTIRDNFEEFKHRAEWTLHSREMYNEARKKLSDDEFLCDIEKAMHYAIQQIQSFAGLGGWGYAITADKIVSGKWLPFLRRLDLINARLKRVQIECLDFEDVIKKYDTEKTLFYVDPPYVEKEYYYNKNNVNFGFEDHERLASLLQNIKGSFVLSYYEHKLVRKLYGNCRIISKQTIKHSRGSVGKYKHMNRPRATDLLIMNY